MIIGVDALGGDFCPRIPVEAAVKAMNQGIADIALIGDENSIKEELKKYTFDSSKLTITHAPEMIEMQDQISAVMRTKRNSSIRRGFQLHKSGEIDAFVSAGHSGAMLAIGKSVLRTVGNIERPFIGALMPTIDPKKMVLLADAGANMDVRPIHLFQFAIISSIYMEYCLETPNPRIGLLNIGSEEGKGNSLVKETYNYFKDSRLNFVGNVEGKEFFSGLADIVICDGFAGNVLLKSMQGAVKFITQLGKEEIKNSFLVKLALPLLSRSLKKIYSQINYSNFGGAPLLGLKGVSVVCHGNSDAEAILTGIKYAKWAATASFMKKIEEVLEQEMLKLNIPDAIL